MSGPTPIDSGRVPILTLNPAKSTERRVRAMENISQPNANVTKTITERDASIGTSVRLIKIVVCRASALTLEALHCHVNSAIAI